MSSVAQWRFWRSKGCTEIWHSQIKKIPELGCYVEHVCRKRKWLSVRLLISYGFVQAMWSYMEAVFSGGDIVKQLPQEAKRFQNIDKGYMKVTNFLTFK